MTDDQTTEATEPTSDHDQQASRPQVKNVRPNAVSGLDHEVLNPDAAADAETTSADDLNPETDTDPSVHLAGDDSEQSEGEKPGAGGDDDTQPSGDGNQDPTPDVTAGADTTGGEGGPGEQANDPDSQQA